MNALCLRETRSQEEIRRDAFGDDLGRGPVEASVDYGAAAGTSSSPMPKRVGGGGGGRRPAAARPKMVSPSKAKGIGGVVGGGGGGGASRGLEEAPARGTFIGGRRSESVAAFRGETLYEGARWFL